MMRPLVAVLAIGLAAFHAFAQPKIGETAPEIAPASFVGVPAGKSAPTRLADLRGKVVVLEFWATWCGPCVAAIQHMNELAETFSKDPVVFISITCDDRETVEKFVEKRPFKTWVAVDNARKTFAAYARGGIPYTAIIDREGKIAALTRPDAVTDQVMRDALAGRALNLPVATDRAGDLDWAASDGIVTDEGSLAHAILQRSQATMGTSRFARGSGRIDADGVTWRPLVELAFEADPAQVVGTLESLEQQTFRVSVKAPEGNDEAARSMMRELLRASLGIAAEWKDEERSVMVLSRKGGAPAPQVSAAGKPMAMARSGTVKLERVGMQTLAKLLGSYAGGKLGVDETGLEGVYDISLQWTPGNKESLAAALAAHGLEATTSTRRVRVLLPKVISIDANKD